MKDTYYFQHDYNARNDPKLQRLIMKCGCEGIGIYWCIVEQLYEQGGKLPNNHIETIAFNLHTTKTTVEEVVFGLNLFVSDDEFFWSESVLKRLENRSLISSKRSESGKKGGAPIGNKNAVKHLKNSIMQDDDETKNKQMVECETSKNKQMVEKNKQKQAIKGKERKEKNIYNIESNKLDSLKKDFSPPPVLEQNSKINEQEKEKNSAKKEKIDFDADAIVSLFHKRCPSFPRIIKLSKTRKQKIEIRFIDEMNGDWGTIETVFRKMEESKFLRGDNPRGWKANFDWLFANDKNWCKVAEGNYDNRVGGGIKIITAKTNDEWQ